MVPSIRVAIRISVLFYAVYLAVWVSIHVLGRFGLNLDVSTAFLIKQVIAWSATLLVSRRVAKATWGDCYPLKTVSRRIWLPLVLASIGGTVVLVDIAGWLPMPELLRDALEKTFGDNFASFMAIVVVAPIAEEHFFRGWVLRGFLGSYARRKAVIASALLFAIFHLNPWQAVVAFPLGIAYARLVLKTGSLTPSILSHMVVNGTSLFALKQILTNLGYSEEAVRDMVHFPWPFLVGGVALVLMGGWWLYREVMNQRSLDTEAAT